MCAFSPNIPLVEAMGKKTKKKKFLEVTQDLPPPGPKDTNEQLPGARKGWKEHVSTTRTCESQQRRHRSCTETETQRPEYSPATFSSKDPKSLGGFLSMGTLLRLEQHPESRAMTLG